jgi:hypothetical protein
VLWIRDVLSRIRIPKFVIPDPGGKKHLIPDSTVHKKRDKNKTNLFLAPYVFRNKLYSMSKK